MLRVNGRFCLAGTLVLLLAASVAGPNSSAQAAAVRNNVRRASTNNLSAGELVTRAYNCLKAGDGEKAIDLFTASLRKDPRNTVTRRYLAYTYLQQGQPSEAMEQLKTIATISKTTAYDMFLTGMALDALGNTKAAAQYFVYASDEEPSNEFYRIRAIDALRGLSLYDDATDLVNEGLSMTSNKASRANYATKLGQIESARKLVNIQITCHQSN